MIMGGVKIPLPTPQPWKKDWPPIRLGLPCCYDCDFDIAILGKKGIRPHK